MTTRSRLWTQLRVTVRVVRAVLRSPALRRVELAYLTFNAVEFGTWVAILLYAYAAIGPTSVGVVAVVQLVPSAIVAPLSANLGDRFPRDRVLFGGYLIMAAAFGATWLVMAADAPSTLVIIAAAFASASLSVIRSTQGALLPSLARTPEELTAANGLSGMVEGMGLLLGPLIAAAILGIATPAAVFGAATAGCLLAAALVARLPQPTAAVGLAARPALVEPADRGGLLDGLRIAARHGDTRLVVAILSLRMVVIGALDVLFVLLALEVFHIGESGAGLLNAALGLGVIAGGTAIFALVGRQRLAPVLGVAAGTSGLGLIVLSAASPVWAAPLIVTTGIGLATCDVLGRTILQRVTPDRVLARVFGALEGLALAGLAVGSILAPVMVLAVGVHGALVVAGFLLPLGIATSWLGLRAMDRHALVPWRALDLLRAVEIFAPLPPPQLEWIARQARWITFEPGDVVITEGDAGDAYYVLETGALRVTQRGELLRVLSERGDGIGEIALLRDVPRTATVTSETVSVMLMVGRSPFLEAVTGHAQAFETARRVVGTMS
ncbi:MAG TPA: MFS transporter [Candidatus Limnocylindrales bacterium]|jgi:MFS family permease